MRKTSWISLGVCLGVLLALDVFGLAQTLRVDGNRVAVGSLDLDKKKIPEGHIAPVDPEEVFFGTESRKPIFNPWAK